MLELRLIDPDGYTVPGTVHTVPDTQADTVRAWLLAEVAVQDAGEWNAAARAGYSARDYRVQSTVVNVPAVTAQLDTAA